MNSREFGSFYDAEYQHESITIEEIANSGLGHYTLSGKHPWVTVQFKNGGMSDDDRMLLLVTFVLEQAIHDTLTSHGIVYSIMKTSEDLILVFKTPDDAIMARLLCDG